MAAGRLPDTYTDRVNKLIKAKGAGREIEAADEAPEPTNVTDLLEVLRRSVDDAKRRRSGGATATPAKKSAGKPTRKSTARGASDDLKAMSKTELAGLARKLDVSGRSSMSRSDLEKAVRKAQRAS